MAEIVAYIVLGLVTTIAFVTTILAMFGWLDHEEIDDEFEGPGEG